MDSLSNGEVLGTGRKDPPADAESQSLLSEVVKPIKNKERTDDKEVLLNDFSEPESNSNVESSLVTEELLDNISTTKENGISNEKHPESEALPCSPETARTDNEDKIQELENNSSHKPKAIEKELPDTESNEEQTLEIEENCLVTSKSSNSIAGKENAMDEANEEVDLPSSPEGTDKGKCINDQNDSSSSNESTEEKVCQDNEIEETKRSTPPSIEEDQAMDCSEEVDNDKVLHSETKTTDKNDSSPADSKDELKNLSVEVGESKDKSNSPPLAEIHTMEDESAESSQICLDEKEKNNSSIDSNVALKNSNEDSDKEVPMDCDEQPDESVQTKKLEQSPASSSEELSLSGVENDKPLEIDLKDDGKSLTNSQEKLEEQVSVDEDVPNDKEKNVPSPNKDSPSVAETPTISSSISDKDNKNSDSATLQERLSKDSTNSFVFAELTNEETGFPDAFTGLVKIGKYISVKGDFTLRSSEALVESPSLVAPYLLKEPDVFPPKEKDANKSEIKDFFHSAAGEILIGIGVSRVNEWFHKDMVRIKKRQIKRKPSPELEKDLEMHEKLYEEARKGNNVFSFDFRVCETCGFTTESSIVMEGHLLIPHLTQRREYQCNFCETIKKDAKDIIEHMKLEHGKIGRIQPPNLFFECIYCSFESNSKVKLNHHLMKCQRVYDPSANQAPGKDSEFPALTPKPITVAVVKAYEKSLGSMQKGRGRPKKDSSESIQHMNQFAPNSGHALGHMPPYRGSSNSPLADSLMQNQMLSGMLRTAQAGSMLRPGMHMPQSNQFYRQMMPMMGNNHLANLPFSQNMDGSKKSTSSIYNKIFESNMNQLNAGKQPSLTITPLPKLTGPYPVPMAKPSSSVQSGATPPNAGNLVVCEICDGYIKDLEQLRTHMQLIHKVKIHPKMLVSRPPLNCQKCQWRFFTDQGLERHLLGAHGLVTSNMQEMANKGKDAGCCTICGRVYANKLVSHMNQVHKISLKPAHLSYKCTVCSATFNLYRLFENHVYLVHSGAGKRSADGRSSPTAKKPKPSEEEDAKNHKNSTSEDVGDENMKKCKECGCNIGKDSEELCEKCLRSEQLVEEGAISAKTMKDELKHKGKAIEKAAA